ncbi:hypothetical protein M0802_015654 [Mischocyttarus mexicanus]|nr:hypothetical protein M0802_015654 [Mischocyttarus mexicanus]
MKIQTWEKEGKVKKGGDVGFVGGGRVVGNNSCVGFVDTLILILVDRKREGSYNEEDFTGSEQNCDDSR